MFYFALFISYQSAVLVPLFDVGLCKENWLVGNMNLCLCRQYCIALCLFTLQLLLVSYGILSSADFILSEFQNRRPACEKSSQF